MRNGRRSQQLIIKAETDGQRKKIVIKELNINLQETVRAVEEFIKTNWKLMWE